MPAHNIHRKAAISLLAIALFILCYIILFALAVGLGVITGYIGINIILLKFTFITLVFGVGLIGLGVLVVFFMLKFMFKKHKVDRSGMMEIREADAPALYALIRSIAEEVGTSFPKKIFLTSDVNASVFYDSNFWSMFFPVRKNLQIGLGLVNAVSDRELKAILAHEFGHFSQKSMKIGSYVYNVNQIIFNLLYENDSYHNLLNRFSSMSRYFYYFALASLRIVQGIQWILGKTYYVVNLSYMGLSREMEFHADAVAASVAGSQPLIDSLTRLDFANAAQNQVLQFYSSQVQAHKKSGNIYPQHAFAMQLLACRFRLPLREDGLPAVEEEHVRSFNRSQLEIKDQWASHPDTKDRVQRLRELNIPSPGQDGSAWAYFADPEALQRQVTGMLYAMVSFDQSPEVLTDDAFCALYRQQMEADDFDPRYQGFYDQVQIPVFDLEAVLTQGGRLATMADVFNDRARELPYIQQGLAEDISKLEQIYLRDVKINTFDYAGTKYNWRDAEGLIRQLKEEQERTNKEIELVSQKAFVLFAQLAGGGGERGQLSARYEIYFAAYRRYEDDMSVCFDLVNATAFMRQTTPFDQILARMPALKKAESVFKERLKVYSDDPQALKELDEEATDRLNPYLDEDDLVYFSNNHYQDAHVDLLFSAIRSFQIMAGRTFFHAKKDLLVYQVVLADRVTDQSFVAGE